MVGNKPDTIEVNAPVVTLKKGDRYFPVDRVQAMLRPFFDHAEPGGTPIIISVDGDFGPQTEECVKFFQGNNNLTVDGIVGPKTWTALTYQFLTSDPG